MGSLNEGVKGIEASLGGLVWVQRRNGRWWPGRILGPEELPDPPKPGTAIKLLAKADDCVDWYNVEQSKIVKAFRCGEYDECIEKAEVAASNSSKKTGKYATTEDAILHALEIERACLGKDHPSSNAKRKNQEHRVEVSPRSFRHHETNNVNKNSSNSEHESDSAQGLSSSIVSSGDPVYTGSYREQTVDQTSSNSEDDGSGGAKHMKGHSNLGTPAITSSKRKRFQLAHVREFLKKKHRRRTVTKFLESSIVVSVPVVYEKLAHPTKSLPQGASVPEVSGLSSDVPKLTFSLKDDDGTSDAGLYDVLIVTEEQHCADLDPLEYNGSEGAHVCGGTSNENSQVVDNGISKWQLKRKRSRHNNKKTRLDLWKFTDGYDEVDEYVIGGECSIDHNAFSGSHPSDNSTRPFKSRAIADINIDEERGWTGNTSHEDPHGSLRRIPRRESRFSKNSKYQDFLVGHHKDESALFDVNLVVETNSRPQHVPYVSLTSKINGPSITGHLLTVEVLDDGSCDNLISESIRIGGRCKFMELDELGETTTALETRLSSVGRTPLKHALPNVTSSKSRKYGLLSKKIRKLSSLTKAREECEDDRKLIVEQGRGPSLTCVPLTIVFSRMNEALSCPK